MKFLISKEQKKILNKRLADIVIEYADDETRALYTTTQNMEKDIEKHIIKILSVLLEEE